MKDMFTKWEMNINVVSVVTDDAANILYLLNNMRVDDIFVFMLL